MLDSLVRVSRRVGWRADRDATDPWLLLGPDLNDAAGGRGALRAVHPGRTDGAGQAGRARGRERRCASVVRPTNASRDSNTRPGAGHLSRGIAAARQPVVALSPRKVRPSGGGRPRSRTNGSGAPRTPLPGRVEFPGQTLRFHPFASERFHVLLNSLFKVLFNFPSRYLSAIGLVSVFSLRWSLPPTWGCILKQPDSQDAHRDAARRR